MAEQDKHQQHRHRLVELHAGEEEGRAHAEQITGADRQHHQHRHVGHAILERAPGGDHERPDRIDHRNAGKQEQPDVERQAERRHRRREHAAHWRIDEDRDGEGQGNPEAVAHVARHRLRVHARTVAHFVCHRLRLARWRWVPSMFTRMHVSGGRRRNDSGGSGGVLWHADVLWQALTRAVIAALVYPGLDGLDIRHRLVVHNGGAASDVVDRGPVHARKLHELLFDAERAQCR